MPARVQIVCGPAQAVDVAVDPSPAGGSPWQAATESAATATSPALRDDVPTPGASSNAHADRRVDHVRIALFDGIAAVARDRGGASRGATATFGSDPLIRKSRPPYPFDFSSLSMSDLKASAGWAPTSLVPLMKNVGVPVAPTAAPSLASASTRS